MALRKPLVLVDGQIQQLQAGDTIGDGSVFTDGNVTGDIVRWNEAAGVWEVATEPFVFKGIVLTPALASLVDAEGAVYYKSDEKVVMVCTET